MLHYTHRVEDKRNLTDSDDLIIKILCIEPMFELSLSVPLLLINIYFVLRFSKIECFSPNLRILLVISNIMTSLSTILHPLPQFIHPDYYSIKKGQYVGAFIVYGIHHISMIILVVVVSKFLLIGIERLIAFKLRENYETRDASGSKKVLTYYIMGITLLVSLKSALLFYFSDDVSIDDRLAFAFVEERCALVFTSMTCVAGFTWILCVIQFFYLSHLVKKCRHQSKSLSESFEIRQIAKVVEVIIPLLVAYIIGVIYSGACMISIIYLHFVKGHSTQSPYYLVFANAAYYSIPLYTTFSTSYMTWYFREMRNAVFHDIKWLFGIEFKNRVNVHHRRDPEEEARMYFNQLKEAWK